MSIPECSTARSSRVNPIQGPTRCNIFRHIGTVAVLSFYFDKLFAVVSKLLQENQPQLLTATRGALSHCISVLGVIDLTTGLHWVFFGKKKDWAYNLENACRISRRAYMVLKTVDRSFYALPIIQNLPILDLANHSLRIGGACLAFARHYKDNARINRLLEQCQRDLKEWEESQELIKDLICVIPNQTINQSMVEGINRIVKESFGEALFKSIECYSKDQKEGLLSLQRVISHHVTKHREQLSKIEENKHHIKQSLINDVSRIALGTLGLIGFLSGATILVSSGWFILSITLCVRAFGAYRALDSAFCPAPRLEHNLTSFAQLKQQS